MTNLERAVKCVEQRICAEVTLDRSGEARYETYGLWIGDDRLGTRVVIYGDNSTAILHELGHILCSHGLPPISPISQLLRELEAWRAAEALAYKFDIPFDDDVFGEGLSSYISGLVASEECPSYEWLSQLLGDEL